MSDDKMIEMVRNEVAQALGRTQGEVSHDSWLKKDLNAESIDLIDLTFRFEKALGRPLSEQEIFRSRHPDGDVTVEEIAAALNLTGESSSGP